MSGSTRDIEAHLRRQVVPRGTARHGLVVGVEKYRDSRLNLRCSRADAQAVYNLMVDPDCGMFAEDNVHLLLDDEATHENIWRAMAHLRRAAGDNDTVWVYYAGHAAPEESTFYWVAHDTDIDDLYGTGISNTEIARVLDDIRAERLVVILDCCHAAATSIQRNPTRAVPTAEEVFASYQGKGRVTLSSSDGKEKSVELSELGHGAFTYFLEKGLRGEADTDGDGVVTADELWNYLHRKVAEVSRKAGNPQTPILIGKMSHDLPLSLNPVATGRKKRISDAIADLVGLDDDQLATEEALFCLDVLRYGPKNMAETELARQLARLPDGQVEPRIVKVLAVAAIRSADAQPAEPRVEPTPVLEEEPEVPVAEYIGFVERPTPLTAAHDRPASPGAEPAAPAGTPEETTGQQPPGQPSPLPQAPPLQENVDWAAAAAKVRERMQERREPMAKYWPVVKERWRVVQRSLAELGRRLGAFLRTLCHQLAEWQRRRSTSVLPPHPTDLGPFPPTPQAPQRPGAALPPPEPTRAPGPPVAPATPPGAGPQAPPPVPPEAPPYPGRPTAPAPPADPLSWEGWKARRGAAYPAWVAGWLLFGIGSTILAIVIGFEVFNGGFDWDEDGSLFMGVVVGIAWLVQLARLFRRWRRNRYYIYAAELCAGAGDYPRGRAALLGIGKIAFGAGRGRAAKAAEWLAYRAAQDGKLEAAKELYALAAERWGSALALAELTKLRAPGGRT